MGTKVGLVGKSVGRIDGFGVGTGVGLKDVGTLVGFADGAIVGFALNEFTNGLYVDSVKITRPVLSA